MILDHVTDRAGLIVERSSALNSEVFRHGNLHALDLIAVPERLQQRVLEAEENHIMHRPLAQIMIDAEDVLLVEIAKQNLVKRLRRCEVVTKGFFNDDTSAVGAVC